MRVPAVVGLVTAVVLPSARSLATPPTTLPGLSSQGENCNSGRRLWTATRRPQSNPTVRCKEEPRAGGRDPTPPTAGGRSSSWGGGLSSWVPGASFFGRSTPHASSTPGIGPCWNGSSSSSGGGEVGGGGGGGSNGTGGGVSEGGAMDEGDESVEAPNLSTSSSSSSSSSDSTRSDGPCSAAEFGSWVAIKTGGAVFEPWVWLSAIWGLYAVWLRKSPLVTKAVTSGVLALGGDVAAQFFEFQQQTGSGRKGPFLKDARRLIAVAIDSMLITGPALHCLYGLLERFIPTAAGGFLPAASHVLIDTFIFDPMFVASFFCVTGMLENRSFKQDIMPALRREFWPAVHGSWIVSFFFCPIQFLTFRYLPLEFRVLSVNVGDIAWTSVLSYFSHKAPPEAEKREKTLTIGGSGAHKNRASEGRKQREIANASGKAIRKESRKASGGEGRGVNGSNSGIKGPIGAKA